MTLNVVRKLQNKLHHLEQSLLHTGNPTSAAGAAAPHVGETLQGSAHSGSHGDITCDFEDLRSPGAEGASGSNVEIGTKNSEPTLKAESSHRHGKGGNLEAVQHPQPSLKEQEEGRWSHSQSHQPTGQRSQSQGRSKRLPLTNRSSQAEPHTHPPLDYNRNATTEPPPACMNSKMGTLCPTVVGLALSGMISGKEGSEPQTAQLREGGGEMSVTKPQSIAPHLSMSKRQLLDEIRREKDEHRKNVR